MEDNCMDVAVVTTADFVAKIVPSEFTGFIEVLSELEKYADRNDIIYELTGDGGLYDVGELKQLRMWYNAVQEKFKEKTGLDVVVRASTGDTIVEPVQLFNEDTGINVEYDREYDVCWIIKNALQFTANAHGLRDELQVTAFLDQNV